jgi:hypothetical protein
MIPHDTHLHIGSLLFEGIDQIDLTGPFEVLSRIPNATYRIYGKTTAPVRDLKGLWLTPDATLADAPPLDVLHVPGGFGQEALMEEAEVLSWIRRQARAAFSRCAQEPCCAARPGCSKGAARRHTGRRFTSCHILARSRSTSASSSMAPGSSPRALRPASTAPCGLRPSCAATRPLRQSSFTWPTRRNRPSTVARPRRRRPKYCFWHGNRCVPSRRSASKPHGAWPPGSELRLQPRAANDRHKRFGENRGLIGIHANHRGPKCQGTGTIKASAAMTPWKSQHR